MPPDEETADLAAVVLAVDGRGADEEQVLNDRQDESDALERLKGALTERRIDDTEW